MFKTSYFVSTLTDPYKNIAFERYLTLHAEEGAPMLFLWRNADTVVIGKNQNSFSECRVDALYNDGGRLARRFSGGGAVYHDMGNLNFSFIESKSDYSLNKHYEVIRRAVSAFGISAEVTGRNDVTVDGRKFSGNAFFEAGSSRCHHGTLLIKTDPERLRKYLNVSAAKLKSKGVESVISRVINLSQLSSVITPDTLSDSMLMAFNEVYGCAAHKINENELNQAELQKIEALLSSDDWVFSKRVDCEAVVRDRFAWGEIDIAFTVSQRQMTNVAVYSDALDTRIIDEVQSALEKAEFSHGGIDCALKKIDGGEQITADIRRMLYEKL